nr:hypothetical protein [Streptomyces sp. SID5468]
MEQLLSALAASPEVRPGAGPELVAARDAEVRTAALREVDVRLAAMTLPDNLRGTLEAPWYATAWRNCRAVVAELAGAGQVSAPQPVAPRSAEVDRLRAELAIARKRIAVLNELVAEAIADAVDAARLEGGDRRG